MDQSFVIFSNILVGTAEINPSSLLILGRRDFYFLKIYNVKGLNNLGGIKMLTKKDNPME